MLLSWVRSTNTTSAYITASYWQREISKQAFRTVSLTQSDIHIANATDVPTALLHTPNGSQVPRTDSVNQGVAFLYLQHSLPRQRYQALTPTFLSWLSGTRGQLTLNDVISSIYSGNEAQWSWENLRPCPSHTPNILPFRLWGIKGFWFVASFILEKNTISFLS